MPPLKNAGAVLEPDTNRSERRARGKPKITRRKAALIAPNRSVEAPVARVEVSGEDVACL
jgi:hypothetical protein